ncbi:MAG: hypothetical protein C4521_07370 [Actinobacteria bacterium]|nr:MAG: hypothetical protein C4521_07370 [Actinomycetota bacterium]
MTDFLAGLLAAQSGNLTAVSFGVALVGGVVAGFGPCVLPMMPAVFGLITGRSYGGSGNVDDGGGEVVRSLLLAGVFVAGMSTVFAGIGALAGLMGRAVLISRWAYYPIAAVCLVIGLQLLGLINISLPGISGAMNGARGRGPGGIFLFGMMFGLIASPCSTPILAAIATLAAMQKNLILGGALLFVFGLGKGLPLLLVGAFSGILPRLTWFSRATGSLSKVGGASLVILAGYLVWVA